MKKFTFLSIAMSALVASSLTAHAGTGVGNGDTGSRDQYIEKLKAELSPSIKVLAGNHVNTGDVEQWCSRVASILRREREAAINLVARNQLELAEQSLIDAMLTAAQSIDVDPSSAKPITKALLDRGLILSQALDQLSDAGVEVNTVSKLNFLVDYVDLIIEITNEVDEPFYLSYVYRFDRCRNGCDDSSFNMKDFQAKYLDYAARELSFVYTQLTEEGPNGMVYPVGSAKVYLKVAELVSAWVAADIADNLFAAQFACSIEELQTLGDTLYRYNTQGDQRFYGSDVDALYLSRHDLENVVESLQDTSCHFSGN